MKQFRPYLRSISNNVINEVKGKRNLILTDVSLRDGIQSMTPQDITYSNKIDIFHRIYSQAVAKNIEIGSFVNTSTVPVMKDVAQFHRYCAEFIDDIPEGAYEPKLHALVPNLKYLEKAVKEKVEGVSFVVSTTYAFQKRNTGKSLWDAHREIMNMDTYLSLNHNRHSILHKKVYISCINECPLSGIIHPERAFHIINMYYNFINIDEICLSDTCGTLKVDDLAPIIERCKAAGFDTNMLSLHIHEGQRTNEETRSLISYALDNGIIRFDVSILTTGGCMMTLPAEKRHANLRYETLYDAIFAYNDSIKSNKINM